ncbi:glycoside hydrolase family 18 protein [Flavivirga spongiicola]|uniref:chitinase n=1 Tax=Flavivirga spongiicola TaxID=421621 RepID=A0ABU7XTB2_9FLAO|nr:glycoside hydrolase family 18 protein [Flavivirga sp. MEBiC05379]MDO5978092.1 glycoside hydrolase family 18 protein [Flavivirga sp. MEBiC05379]
MKYILLYTCSLFIFLSCTSKKNENLEQNTNLTNKKVIAYVNSWQDNWGDNFEKANLITHINYAFANIKDGEVVEGRHTDFEIIKKLIKLKEKNKDLKILISVGGWSWSKNFSDAVLTEASREKFANSAISFMKRHNIDGIDLDWEYPGLPGAGNVHRPEDKENFTAILKLLREKLDGIATSENQYLLTIASGASQNYLDHTNMKEAHKYLDFINIMTYDFHGGGEAKTGHHANLNPSNSDDNPLVVSVVKAVQEHVNAGIPIGKIVLGVPFYGRWWKGANPMNNGLYQKTKGTTGSYNYNAIIDSINSNKGYTEYWDEAAKAPYIWRQKDSLFITYDNAKSLKYKVDFVNDKQLGGIMFWQFNGDNGTLLNTIYNNLYIKE